MKVNKPVATLLVASGLVIGGLGAGAFMASPPGIAHAAPIAQAQPTTPEGDQVQDPNYAGSVSVNPSAAEGVSEADEATALQGEATITAAEAEAAALAANPGATVLKTELDNENGYLVYSVELDNGMDVKVDAGNSAILATEQDEDGAEVGEANESESEEADANDTDSIQDEQEDGDQNDVQEEHDGQPDDAAETPGVEDAIGQ